MPRAGRSSPLPRAAEKALYRWSASDPPSSRCVYRAAADLGIRARERPAVAITADDLEEIVRCTKVGECAPCPREATVVLARFSGVEWRWPGR